MHARACVLNLAAVVVVVAVMMMVMAVVVFLVRRAMASAVEGKTDP